MWFNLCFVMFIVSCTFKNVDSDLIGCRNEKNEVVISNFNGRGEHNSNIFLQRKCTH